MTEHKKIEDMTPEEFKEMKIEFAPGCFDNFEGSQEELDGLIAEIQRMFESGEAQKMARPLNIDDLDDEDLEMLERIAEQQDLAKGRKLQ